MSFELQLPLKERPPRWLSGLPLPRKHYILKANWHFALLYHAYIIYGGLSRLRILGIPAEWNNIGEEQNLAVVEEICKPWMTLKQMHGIILGVTIQSPKCLH